MSEDYKYDLRGVSATKSEVHAAIKGLDKGLYPNAFCKILPDVTGGNDPEYCNLMHADTAGTKTSIAYMYWKETGDLSVWRGIAQDSIVMNLDDMACVGCVDDIVLSSTIGRNKLAISGDVIAQIISGSNEFIDGLKEHGINIHMAGGETADVGDIVRTIDVGYTAFARMKRDQVIVNNIQPGDVIVGLASYGQASYEHKYNAGTGSNGLTSARHDLLHSSLGEKYPESYDRNMPKEVAYVGKYKLTDKVDFDGISTDIGSLILSPTRTYLPVLKKILETHRSKINGLIHCTGGGQVKVEKFIQNRRVIKNNLLETPYLFKLIQEAANADWREMYQVYNMGHRLEFYLPKEEAQAIIDTANSFGIEAQIVGYVEESEGNEVIIDGTHGTFKY
ncbi:MAG: phosphoribosylformylglycinamidine cyclo-ligase [Polaribacter sp.]|jgi:phosphoribosylformylglycinamidine cyclo-ligase